MSNYSSNVLPEEVDGTGHKVHYKSFKVDIPYKCSVCEKFLKGLFFQGYKCESKSIVDLE